MIDFSRLPRTSAGWYRVCKSHPCPVCGHIDYCVLSPRGVYAGCMRVAEGAEDEKRTRIGPMYLHRISKAAQIKPEKLPKPKPSQPPIDFSAVAQEAQETLSREGLFKFAQELGVSPNSLERLRTGWLSASQVQRHGTKCRSLGCWAWPMWDGEQVVGIRLRTMDGGKFAMKGSAPGLFVPPDIGPDKPLVIVEGPTDCAAGLDTGLPAIGIPSNQADPTPVVTLLQRNLGKPPEIWICRDRDEPGTTAYYSTLNGAKKLAAEVARYVPVKILKPPGKHKDMREWRPSRAVLESVAGSTKPWRK